MYNTNSYVQSHMLVKFVNRLQPQSQQATAATTKIEMHRRKGPISTTQGSNGDDGIYIHHLPTPRRRQHPSHAPSAKHNDNGGSSSSSSSSSRSIMSSNRFGFACILVVLFTALIGIEFMAYRMLGDDSTKKFNESPNSSSGTSASSNSEKDGAPGSRVLTSANGNGNAINPSPKVKSDSQTPPTKHPTQNNNHATTTTTTTTLEPTAGSKRWRLKEAKQNSNENANFWKTHLPDPVPPLPPDDIDPITGSGASLLPPVIAYVTTLTKCGPKHRGGLDGAAVLLHSIRRNSYGWVPMEEQVMKQQQQPQNKNNIGDDNNTSNNRPEYGGNGGKYRYRAYVIVDPKASPTNRGKSGECARYLEKIGYVILHRPPLVPLFEIGEEEEGDEGGDGKITNKKDGGGGGAGDGDAANDKNGDDLSQSYIDLKNQGYVAMQRPDSAIRPGERPDKVRMMMHNDGCCGYTELLKLHVYGMIEHELAVHLDFDSLLLKPMDDLFDAMLGKEGTTAGNDARRKLPLAKLPRTKHVDLGKPIHAAFTRDYNSVINPKVSAPVGYQGGFLVVRPNLTVLERYRAILKRGEFLLGPRDGWEGKFGGFYGDITFQGILPYYYEAVAPEGEHNEVELDRCVYNQMADNPRKSTYKFPRATPLDAKKMGFRDTKFCRDGREDCSDTDCQRTHPKDSITTHFTFCKKPWDCSEGLKGTVASDTCLGLLKEWYGIRRELEDWWLLPQPTDVPASKSSDGLNNQQSFYWKDRTISKVLKTREGTLDKSQYFGYCDEFTTEGYNRMVEPDGPRTH